VTYSIVARDTESGELGVAVQSRSFACGASVVWAWTGVGAIATQAYGEPSYGFLGLELLRAGKSADETLAALVAADSSSADRQVAIVDGKGAAAAHTGGRCLPVAEHALGDGYSAQGNRLASPEVSSAMAEAFEATDAELGERLLAALEAGEAAGGDWAGRQSAAMRVVPQSGHLWERVSDLRVDDHPEPLGELRRLHRLETAYVRINRIEERVAPGDLLAAAREEEAARYAGLSEVDVTWAFVFAAAHAGDVEAARARIQPLLEADPRWREAAVRYGHRGRLPHADELLRPG
jgi:uncharacterized Ntn-hydrolase superfamily protein